MIQQIKKVITGKINARTWDLRCLLAVVQDMNKNCPLVDVHVVPKGATVIILNQPVTKSNPILN